MSGSEKKKRGGNWVFNNNMLKVFAAAIAALIWVVVAMTVGNTVDKTFASVPVNIRINAATFADLGFNPVEVDYVTVTARVTGDRIAVNQLTPEDLTASVKPSIDVTEPGPYTLKLVPANSSLDSRLLTSIQYTPSEVMVRVDRLISKSFKVEAVVNGLTMQEDFIQGTQSVTPSQITVRGPRAEIDKITRCVVVANLTAPLEKTYVEDITIKLLDANGDEIDAAAKQITMDYSGARLVIEALKRATLSLKVDFLNVPRNFPTNALTYLMSENTIDVAGPTDVIEREKEIIVGYIDIRSIDKENSTFTFPVDVSGAYQNLDDLIDVTVSFNNLFWEEEYLNITGASLINVPDMYDVEVFGDTFYNVKFVGDRTAIANLTAEDIVMEVDLAEREISEGQMRVPVKISVPTRGLVWAVGEYNVVIEVTAKEMG